jgi:hypothetical protein
MPKLCCFEIWQPSWTSEAILNPTKNFFSMNYVQLKYKLNQKTERKKFKTHRVLVEKPVLGHFENL